jgi:hypothetical protein
MGLPIGFIEHRHATIQEELDNAAHREHKDAAQAFSREPRRRRPGVPSRTCPGLRLCGEAASIANPARRCPRRTSARPPTRSVRSKNAASARLTELRGFAV